MRVLLISDQPPLVTGFASLLGQVDATIGLVDSHSVAEGMRMLLSSPSADLVVLDLETLGSGRMKGAALLREVWPTVRLAVLSEVERDDEIVRTVEIGALGYLLKSQNMESLAESMRKLLVGHVVVPDVTFTA